MKLALFSDIHANLPALEAFFEHVERQQADALYCLGDLVGYNVWPNEVIDAIRSRKIPCIAGNYDLGIGRSSNDCGCAYKTDIERSMGNLSIAFTNAWISEDHRRFLRTLPSHIRLEFTWLDQPISVLLVHGSPRRVNEYLFEDRDEKSLWRIMDQAAADIMCFGHTHMPYHRILAGEKDGKSVHRHAINVGSVGKPKDKDPRGCYVLLSLDPSTHDQEYGGITVEFKRFTYDVERAAQAIEQSSLPNAYADMLRTA